jgi:hypothetical protein
MERNFGGTQDDDGSMYNTSAYMLVYIREDCQSKLRLGIGIKKEFQMIFKMMFYVMLIKKIFRKI